MVEQQQQHAEYYDKLLHHLNRTFSMNMKAQELFLDMSHQTKTISFKSIKNIYSTLTEGKADEVIYKKDKKTLIDNHVFNQKFTQMTCWRIIEKLITKVSFYLSNEHALGGLAPSVLKVMSFLRNANQKVNNRASFVEFFEEVLDCIIAENNILQQKIYDLLIKRGYIYSIDEFYRLNRFEEEHNDYICPDEADPSEAKQDKSSLEVAGKSIDTSSVIMPKGFRSRFGMFSSKKTALHSRQRTNFEEQRIPEMQVNAESQREGEGEVEGEGMEEQSSSEEEKNQQKAEEFNRISHNIHKQVDKTVDQLLNNHNFQSYIKSFHSQYHVSSMHDSNTKLVKPSVVRQLLKNLKNKNFKANQKILMISSTLQKGKQEQRKNSSQTLMKMKKKQKNLSSLQRNRTSITMALSKGMKQRIFKNQHLADIEDLIINNLDQLQGGDVESYSKESQRVPLKKNILFRPQARQHTQIMLTHNDQSKISTRRASNFQFFNNAFAFQGGKNVPKNSLGEMRKGSNFGPDYQMSLISSNRTIETNSFQDKQQTIEKYANKHQKNSQKSPKSFLKNKNSYISSCSQGINCFANQFKQFPKPTKKYRFFCHSRTRGKTEQFNPNLLKITAQKYNKCITEQSQAAIKTLEWRELNILSAISETSNLDSSSSLNFRTKTRIAPKIIENCQHGRPYEIYDRKLRRML